MKDLYDTMNRLTMIPQDFEGKIKVKNWLDIMAQMKASDELSDEQVRQLVYEIEQSYNAFNKLLHNS